MLSWSVRRRLLYFLAVVVALAVAGLLFAVVYRPLPSCTDGKQNQEELGVDCGGPCATVCPVEISPLRVIWRRLFRVAEGKYDLTAFIQNPNFRHGTQPFRYEFKIWDDAGLLISTRSGTAFANPKEALVIFESRIEVGQRTPARVEFELTENPVWQRFDADFPAVTFSEKRFLNLPTPRLSALVRNPTLDELTNVTVAAVLSDEEENAIAVSSTLVEHLGPGESKEIVFTWPAPFATGVVSTDLYGHLGRSAN